MSERVVIILHACRHSQEWQLNVREESLLAVLDQLAAGPCTRCRCERCDTWPCACEKETADNGSRGMANDDE